MSDDSRQARSVLSADTARFIRLQYEQAVETYRAQFSLLIQMLTVLLLADVTVIGYGINAQKAGVLLIGALFPVVMLSSILKANRLVLPIAYTAVSLEQKCGGDDTDGLISTFLAAVVSVDFVSTLQSISAVQEPIERTRLLRSLKIPVLALGRNLTRTTLILIAIGQVIAPCILWLFFNWPLV